LLLRFGDVPQGVELFERSGLHIDAALSGKRFHPREAADEFVGCGVERHLRVRFEETGHVDSGKQQIAELLVNVRLVALRDRLAKLVGFA